MNDFNTIKGLDEYCRMHNCSILTKGNQLVGIIINEGYGGLK